MTKSSPERNNRRAVEFRREVTLILSEDNDIYLKEMAKERKEPRDMVVSRIINLILNDMRAMDDV